MKTLNKHLTLAALVTAVAACGSDDDTNNDMAMNDTSDATSNDDSNMDSSDTDSDPSDIGAPDADDSGSDAAGTRPADGVTPGDTDADATPTIVEIAVENNDFSQLLAALAAADLVDALSGEGPFTVFAPTDAAFEAFEEENPGELDSFSVEELTAILTYHVVEGRVMSTDLEDNMIAPTLQGSYVNVRIDDGVRVNDANVSTADIEGSNGVIHVIDTIILPASDDIVDTALAAGSYSTLAGALTDTGLVDVLKGEGPFTVFAPTDEAFEAFEEENPGVLASLSEDELADILLYHVASGWVGASDLSDGMSIPTSLEGAAIMVDLSPNGVFLNSSQVTQPNILTTNGVIHVIDAILLPRSE